MTIATEDSLAELNQQQLLNDRDAVRNALNSVTKSDITELKSIRSPNDTLTMVMAAVATALGEEQTDWTSCKKLLSKVNFMNLLIDCSANSVSATTIAKLQQYLQNPGFNPQEVRKKVISAAGLCAWVIAIEAEYRA